MWRDLTFARAFALVEALLYSAPTLKAGTPPRDDPLPLTIEVRPLTLVKSYIIPFISHSIIGVKKFSERIYLLVTYSKVGLKFIGN